MSKRTPTVADKLITMRDRSHLRSYEPKALDQLQRSARQARKFVFDADAIKRVADVIRAVPELLVREQEFARPPFDLTWIEYPANVMYAELNQHVPEHLRGFGGSATADKDLGLLFDHGRVNVFVSGTVDRPDDPIYLSPIQYRLNTEWPFEDQLEFCRRASVSRIGIDQFLWGSTYMALDVESQRSLRDLHAIEYVPMRQNAVGDGSMHGLVNGSIGDFRTIIALLLMLNRPSICRYVRDLPNSRGWLRNRVIPYMAHTHVTIDLDAVPSMRKMSDRTSGIELRCHEVRAHYCHDKTARDMMRIAGCIHEFRAADAEWKVRGVAPGEAQRWVCGSCGGKRWQRREHQRGNAALGYVKHESYDVTA